MRSRLERELSIWIDKKMEEMDNQTDYIGGSDEEEVENKFAEIAYRNQLVEAVEKLINEAVKCRKLSESMGNAGLNRKYNISIGISKEGLDMNGLSASQ
ncbi:MAG: hypothetical protein ACP5RM_00995 [Candidatus Micrarchaeia archaeon]